MALNFVHTNTLDGGSKNFISHESDSTMYNYYIDAELAKDKQAQAHLGLYDSISFDNEDRHLTTKAVSKIGIKNFPGIGGIGFYKDAYTNESLIVAPIHNRQEVKGVPVLKVIEVVDNTLHVVIEPPSDMYYTCYRVVVRQGTFAVEYITYKTDYYMNVPYVKGNYTVFCIGHDETNGIISEPSNSLDLVVTTGANNWGPDSLDLSDFETRLQAVENEVQNYDDDEIHEAIAETIENPDPSAISIEEVTD